MSYDYSREHEKIIAGLERQLAEAQSNCDNERMRADDMSAFAARAIGALRAVADRWIPDNPCWLSSVEKEVLAILSSPTAQATAKWLEEQEQAAYEEGRGLWLRCGSGGPNA